MRARRHVLRLEDAVHKMTSSPRAGEATTAAWSPDYFADITIFNPETVRDVATFDLPALGGISASS
jgi:N-acyl-D-aspartate/D-glutamate deacylase